MALELPVTFRLYTNKWRWISMLVLGIVTLLFGLRMAPDSIPKGNYADWLPIALFGLFCILFSWRFHPQAFTLKLDEQGFTICNWFRNSQIAWNDVAKFGTFRLNKNEAVGWDFEDDYPWRGRMTEFSKKLFGFEMGLTETYGLKAQELCDLMNKMLQLDRIKSDFNNA